MGEPHDAAETVSPGDAPDLRPPHSAVYVISDADGYLVSFYGKEEAVDYVLHSVDPVIIQRFPLDPDGDRGNVYAIPYCDINATAFVTNVKADASAFQKNFNAVGLVSNDNVNFFLSEVGKPRHRHRFEAMTEEEAEANRKIIESFMGLIKSDENRAVEDIKINYDTVNIYDYVDMACIDVSDHAKNTPGVSPVSTREDNIGKLPDEAEKNPGEAEQNPDEAEKIPCEAEKIPGEAGKNPGEAEKIPDEAEKNPGEAEKLSDE